MDSRVALAPLVCGLVSCSLLFSESTPNTTVDDDAAAGGIDSGMGTDCLNSTSIPGTTVSLGILHGQRLDLDRDGLEDVLLSTSIASGSPRTFIHYGKCPRTTTWDYQIEWAGRITDTGNEAFDVRAMTLAHQTEDNVEDRLVVIGDTISGARLASFAVREGVPRESSEFANLVPESGGSQSTQAEGPFSLVAGNFSLNPASSANDLAFSDAHQAWSYQVGSWDFPADWTVDCDQGNVQNPPPNQVSNAADRIGILSVPSLSLSIDEIVDVESDRVNWVGFDTITFPRPTRRGWARVAWPSMMAARISSSGTRTRQIS